MDEAALRANEIMGNPEEAFLTIDEISNTNKGKKFNGIVHQLLGIPGKIYKGQIGVLVPLCKPERAP